MEVERAKEVAILAQIWWAVSGGGWTGSRVVAMLSGAYNGNLAAYLYDTEDRDSTAHRLHSPIDRMENRRHTGFVARLPCAHGLGGDVMSGLHLWLA